MDRNLEYKLKELYTWYPESNIIKEVVPLIKINIHNEFKRKLNLFTENLLNSIDWANILLIGEPIFASILPTISRDNYECRHHFHTIYRNPNIILATYSLDFQQIIEISQNIYNELTYILPIKPTYKITDTSVIIESGYPYRTLYRNIEILTTPYLSISHILLCNLEIDCLALGYNGSEVYALYRGYHSLKNKINIVDFNTPIKENQLYTYTKLGYNINIIVPKTHTVNPYIFQKAINKLSPEGKLLNLCFKSKPFKKHGNLVQFIKNIDIDIEPNLSINSDIFISNNYLNFIQSIINNNVEQFNSIISTVNINTKDYLGRTPIHVATIYNRYDFLNKMVSIDKTVIDKKFNRLFKVIDLACIYTDLKTLQLLVPNYNSINEKHILYTVINGDINMFKYIIKYYNSTNSFAATILRCCCILNRLEIAALYLPYITDINIINTVFTDTIMCGSLEFLKLLINYCNKNSINYKECTNLLITSITCYLNTTYGSKHVYRVIITTLLLQNSHYHYGDISNKLYNILVLYKPDYWLIKTVIQHKICVMDMHYLNKINKYISKLKHKLTVDSSLKIQNKLYMLEKIKQVISKIVKTNNCLLTDTPSLPDDNILPKKQNRLFNCQNYNKLLEAVWNNNYDQVQHLSASNLDLSFIDATMCNTSPLHLAIEKDDDKMFKILHDHLSPNNFNTLINLVFDNLNILEYTLKYKGIKCFNSFILLDIIKNINSLDFIKIYEKLLYLGLFNEGHAILKHIDIHNLNHETVINSCVNSCNPSIFVYIFNYSGIGIKPNYKDSMGNTILHLLCKFNGSTTDYLNCILLILKLYPNSISSKNLNKCTPIMVAIEHECISAVQFLLKHQPNLLLYNKQGLYPIHIAVKTNNIELINILVGYNSGLINMVTMYENYTPYILALIHKNYKVFEHLLGLTNNCLYKKDIYGNTIYHYMATNSYYTNTIKYNLCSENIFGLTPNDYVLNNIVNLCYSQQIDTDTVNNLYRLYNYYSGCERIPISIDDVLLYYNIRLLDK